MIVTPSSVSITARKSGRKGPAAVAMREVHAAEAATDRALAASLGEQQGLLTPALKPGRPALGIGEADPVQLLDPQSCTPATSEPALLGSLTEQIAHRHRTGRYARVAVPLSVATQNCSQSDESAGGSGCLERDDDPSMSSET